MDHSVHKLYVSDSQSFFKSPQCGCETCSSCASPYRWTPGRPTTPGGRAESWRAGSWRRRSLWGEPARSPGEESGRLREESSVRWVRSGVTLWRLQEVDSAVAVRIFTFNKLHLLDKMWIWMLSERYITDSFNVFSLFTFSDLNMIAFVTFFFPYEPSLMNCSFIKATSSPVEVLVQF